MVVAFYLAATVRQTREHAYVFFGPSFKTVCKKIRAAGSGHDCICYSYITPSRLVLGSMVSVLSYYIEGSGQVGHSCIRYSLTCRAQSSLLDIHTAYQ